MILKKSLIATFISAAVCSSAFAQEDEFPNRIYVGVGAGSSTLSPESQVPELFLEDDSDSGTKFFVGYDFSPRLAIEFTAADLGSAEIGPNNAGSISYDVLGLSGVYHFTRFGSRERLLARTGFGLFAKLGVGLLDNDSNLMFERENDTHLSGGLGIEYATRFGLGFRGEFEAFDEDAELASVSVFWRFGGAGGGSDSLTSTAGAVGGAVGGLLGIDEEKQDNNDSDGDGVPNNLDDCANTAGGIVVSATGCPAFGGVLEGVQFASGSDRLVDEAQVVLNDAADILLNNPSLKVEIQAHTDSQGAEEYNLDLSKKRALATVRYLMLRGVSDEQLTARAFGETKPIADNATPEGRETNRRVEFHVIER